VEQSIKKSHKLILTKGHKNTEQKYAKFLPPLTPSVAKTVNLHGLKKV